MKTKLLSLFTTIAFMLTASLSMASHLGEELLFSARMNGAQEVPSVDTDAQGVAGFTLNNTRDQLCVNVAVNGLTGPITGAHIHAGAPGMTGDPVIDLSSGILGNQITITISGTDLSAEAISMMLQGKTYINIHTDANPGGEIRGQVVLESDWNYEAKADGMQAVPMVDTDARGLGVFTLSKNQSMIQYQFIAEGLSGPITAAHLHAGAMGETGGVEQNLSGDISGNMISGSFVPTPSLLMNLMMGEIYLNVHTDANPDGEIRSQLWIRDLAFDAKMDGSQEVPASLSLAMGVTSIHINTMLDTIWYDVQTDGLSGAITGAHLHAGIAGETGDPIVDFTDDIDGNRITGMITGADVTDDLINALLSGETYVNVHTSLFPSGEIRGQVYRVAREGYTALLTGGQEVPGVETEAYGGGIVSVDRNQSNAHFMFVVGNLSGALGGAHFHTADMGETGAVIFNLTPYFSGTGTDDAAYGYWTSEDPTPFNPAQSLLFRDGLVYVNLHTDANPDGEIRGQINRGLTCYNLLSIDQNELEMELNVYPNPFINNLTLESKSLNENMTVELMNVNGQIVASPFITNKSERIEIATNDLNPGIYFLVIKENNAVVSVKKVTKL